MFGDLGGVRILLIPRYARPVLAGMTHSEHVRGNVNVLTLAVSVPLISDRDNDSTVSLSIGRCWAFNNLKLGCNLPTGGVDRSRLFPLANMRWGDSLASRTPLDVKAPSSDGDDLADDMAYDR